MGSSWIASVRPSTCRYTHGEISQMAKHRRLFRFRPPNCTQYVVPDFQMRNSSVSPWVAPLLGALIWIEDKTPGRDESGLARARWLYRKRAYLSELCLASMGHWPRGWDPDKRKAQEIIELFTIGLDRRCRSFAEVFNQHPRFVIDYQYWLQGVRWDAREYRM